MATNMSDIVIRLTGEFKDKGFKDADKATINLNKRFNSLTRSASRAFIAIAGFTALKRSVQAFAEEDRAVSKLVKSLDNLGLKFESTGIDDYLQNLQNTTAIAKEELAPAFNQLANVTLSVTKAQQLLNTALDVSVATGYSLNSVTTALSRAFNGNYASLGKLQTSYTSAELKAMGFTKSIQALSAEFSGAAAADADSYSGKMNRLSLAIGDAQEAIGKGLIDALEALGGGNYERGLELIAAGGEKIGDAFRFAAQGVAYFKRFAKQGLFATREQLAQFRADMDLMFREDPAKGRTAMRERARFLAAEKAQTEKIRKSRADITSNVAKETALTRAAKNFDLERIQIEAALKGKITDEERTRLLLMKAILDENMTKAELLEGKLKDSIEAQKTLAKSLDSFVANNPFVFWETYFDAQDKERKDLADSLGTFNANTPFTMWGTEWEAQADEQYKLNKKLGLFNANDPFKDWDAYFATQKDSISQVDKGLANLQKAAALTKIDAEGLAQAAADAWDKVFAATDKRTKNALTAMAQAAEDAAAAAEKKALAALEKLNAAQNVVPKNTSPNDKYAGVIPGFQPDPGPTQPILGSDLATLSTSSAAVTTLPLSGVGGATVPTSVPTTVVVNVAGTVTSETDLAEFIIESVYKAQSNGIGISYKPTAI